MRKTAVNCGSTPIVLFCVAGIALFLLLLNPVYGGQLVVNKGVIEKDTIWQGEVLVKADVEVARDATLTIMPGTTVRFEKIEEFGPGKLSLDKLNHFPRAELIIKGKIYAQGTLDKKITFTSAEESGHPGDWGSINLLGSVGNIIEFCVFTYAHTAVHAHSAQVVVSYCTFHYNGVAIGQKNVKEVEHKSVVPMLYNRITENGGGILYGGGSTTTIAHNEINNNVFFGIYAKKGGLANVRYNNITQNGKGVIFYKVKDIVLRDNNIADNKDYNISLLAGQAGDIAVHNNWWGTTDPVQIKNLVRDKTRDEALGTVDFSEFLTGPVAGAGLVW
jgi:hypothetical protein